MILREAYDEIERSVSIYRQMLWKMKRYGANFPAGIDKSSGKPWTLGDIVDRYAMTLQVFIEINNRRTK